MFRALLKNISKNILNNFFPNSFTRLNYIRKTMDSLNFVQSVNPINKQVEWLVVGDDYDYHQEIAVSCYGDMLHDDERVS